MPSNRGMTEKLMVNYIIMHNINQWYPFIQLDFPHALAISHHGTCKCCPTLPLPACIKGETEGKIFN